MKYLDMLKRWFDLRIKASNTRLNSLVIYGCAVTNFIFTGEIIVSVFMAAVGGAFKALWDSVEGVNDRT